MSEPKIWTIKMPDNTLSKWVLHSDYARLKAEVERLNGVIKEVVKEAQENSDRYVRRLKEEAAHPACVAMNRKLGDANNQIHRLKAEVERLTVAADWKTPARKIQALEAEVERLRKAIQKFQAVAPNASNPCGCGFWTCETKDLLELNDALEGKQS